MEKGDLGQSFDTLDVFWARLAVHIRTEHLHLFPTLIAAVERSEQRKENGSRPPSAQAVRDTIARLREDHDFFMQELAAAITQLRKERGRTGQSRSAVLSDVKEKALAVSRRLQTHNALEESEVYRWAEGLLEDAECIDLKTRMNKELAKRSQTFVLSVNDSSKTSDGCNVFAITPRNVHPGNNDQLCSSGTRMKTLDHSSTLEF